MKVWTKVHLRDRSKQVEKVSAALTNYLYGCGPITEICRKYKISDEDRKVIDRFTANRIGGLLMLYLARDNTRINDIVNKYDIPYGTVNEVIPEVEGYIEK